MTRLALALAAGLALAGTLPPGARAHARLLRTDPPDGTVLAQAPSVVRVTFDDTVRPGPRVAAVRNGDGASELAGTPQVAPGGRALEIPLRVPLGEGDYTVRWDVRTDDGHELAGVIAFGVGLGRAAPLPSLSAGTSIEPRDLVARWLLLAGVLAAAGSAAVRALVWRPALVATRLEAGARARVERELHETSSELLLGGFVLAFLGSAAGALEGTDTRSGLVQALAAVAAAVGAAWAGAAVAYAPVLWFPAAAVALALVPVPTLAGHALDASQPPVAPFADLVHVGSAAVWVGALLSLAVTVPRAARSLLASDRDVLYGAVAARTSAVVVVSVLLLSGAGVVRAVEELASVDQLWTTGYGRTILVKTGIFGALIAVGWANRHRLVPVLVQSAAAARGEGGLLFAYLRRNVRVELGGFVVLLAAVALLTDLVPGVSAIRPAASDASRSQAAPPGKPPLPPRGALVLGGQARDLAVGFAARPAGDAQAALTVTVLGQDGSAVPGLDVAAGLDGGALRPARACGPGCYALTAGHGGVPRVARVRVAGRRRAPATVTFRLGERWPAPPAAALVARAVRAFRSLRSVSVDETVESRPGRRLVSHFRYAAPDRMTYRIEHGADAIVIGGRRWDRTPPQPWAASPQEPLSVPTAPWSRARDARLLGASVLDGRRVLVVSFLDPTGPAWFTVQLEPESARTLDVRMTGAAHFMRLRYFGFNAPVRIRPPRVSSR